MQARGSEWPMERLRSLLSGATQVVPRSWVWPGLALLIAGSLLAAPVPTAGAQAGGLLAIGVEGANGALWVQTPQLGPGWHSLGGHIIAPPAVAAIPQPAGVATPLFIAVGTDHALWVRNLANGWQPLSLASTYCVDSPSADVLTTDTGTELTVACDGADAALWTATAAIPKAGLPTIRGGWTSLGGVLGAGPAVLYFEGPAWYWALAPHDQVYVRYATSRWTPYPWYCTNHLAAGFAGGSGPWFACRGTDGQLWAGVGADGPPRALRALGGQLIGGPGVAVNHTGDVSFVAEGTDHGVWIQSARTGIWTSLGGQVIGGVGAVGLN